MPKSPLVGFLTDKRSTSRPVLILQSLPLPLLQLAEFLPLLAQV